jgi:4-hydroxy-tetrahydrodipicolinate synthase
MKILKGVVTPMVTPFLENGEVDYAALRKLTSRLIDAGVNGLYPCGTTGEGVLLTLEERKRVAETVVQETGGRVAVYIQTGAMNLDDTVDLSRHALSCGADGVGVVTPSFYRISQQAIIDYYSALSDELPADFPIYLYSIPDNALNDILPSTAETLANSCPNIAGIKYSGDDFVQLEAYTEIRNGTFSVLAGNDRAFAAVLAAGCDGTVSGLSNIFTELVVSVYTAFRNNEIDKAIQLQKKVYTSSICLFNGFFLAGLKAGLGLRGMPVGKLRKPLPDLTPQQYDALKEALSRI